MQTLHLRSRIPTISRPKDGLKAGWWYHVGPRSPKIYNIIPQLTSSNQLSGVTHQSLLLMLTPVFFQASSVRQVCISLDNVAASAEKYLQSAGRGARRCTRCSSASDRSSSAWSRFRAAELYFLEPKVRVRTALNPWIFTTIHVGIIGYTCLHSSSLEE